MPTLDEALERERLRNEPSSPGMQRAIDEIKAAIDAAFDSSERGKLRLVSAEELEAAQADIARLSAEVEALRQALNNVAGKAELARTIYETEEAATPSYVADAFGIIERFAEQALAAGQDKTGGGHAG